MPGATVTNGTSGSWRYAAYIDPASGMEKIGNLQNGKIMPLSYPSGTPLANLYQVIELNDQAEHLIAGEAIPLSTVKILPPISGRDILCVGKNYSEHAKEFHGSGYDSSDKVAQPTHPVIFTKRATSIIADGEGIFPHPGFTESMDYEGEIGVIIGKAGFKIQEEDAMDYVWGYTIINDMTARERQRDHKQFYIGKSPDTFCPMGPVAVPASKLPKVLRVQTVVNGKPRQDATTEDMIFSIPFLVQTLSEAQTLQPGDVLATGTPAGVGIGKIPPVFLKPGDEVAVSVSGLGTLTNRILPEDASNYTLQRIRDHSAVTQTNIAKSVNGSDLPLINGKPTYYRRLGAPDAANPIFFVHGLGGTSDYWAPLISSLKLAHSHALHLYDFEGHGLSPTSPLSKLTIASLAADLQGVFDHAGVSNVSKPTLVAHSMGCLIAIAFVLANPGLVHKLVLVGPPPSPLPEAGSSASYTRAATARTKGMAAVADAVATAGTSEHTKAANPLALTAVRLSLMGHDPEGYAKACAALAGAVNTLAIEDVDAETLIVTGSEDKISPQALCEGYAKRLPVSRGVVVLKDVGHWHVFEDCAGVSEAVKSFLSA